MAAPQDHDPASASRLREALLRLFGDPAIAEQVEPVAAFLDVPGGTVLFREGDAGDAAFVVLSGRLRAVADGEDGERVLSDATAGETVGEVALITGVARSATVYAVRDSLVARIAAADFDTLLSRHPEAALPITRILAGRLQRLTGTGPPPGGVELAVAVLPVGGRDAHGFAGGLVRALGAHGRARLVALPPGGDTDHAELPDVVDDQGGPGGAVVYVGEPGWSAWNDLVLRHADEVLLLADAAADPAPGVTEDAVLAPRERGGPRVTLVLEHAAGMSPAGTSAWLDPRPGVAHLHVRAGDRADLERVARWVAGRSVGLVLGGGGARGWAHLGALRALEELGIPVDLVGGTSHGAMVGAAVADRQSAAEIRRTAGPLVRGLLDYTVPVVSVIRGRRIGRALEQVVRPGVDIEDLWLPFFAMATNLTRAERMVLTRGPVVEALRASISLPVILPPVVRDGDLVIDGGLLDNLPVGEMRSRLPLGRLIAVDPSPPRQHTPYDPLAPDVSGWRLLGERLRPGGRRRRIPSIAEIVQRTVMAGSLHLRHREHSTHPDTLTLHPDLGDWGLLEFERLAEIEEAGYREMRAPIADWWAEREAASGTGPATGAPPGPVRSPGTPP